MIMMNKKSLQNKFLAQFYKTSKYLMKIFVYYPVCSSIIVRA